MDKKITLFFFGTDAFATVILERLLQDAQFEVKGVMVPPDQPVGRGQQFAPCAVKELAHRQRLPLFYSPMDLPQIAVDFFVVASYGKILSSTILAMPRVACVNIHPSLLPQYRGASPIQSVLFHGDQVTGVCVMKMILKLDAGPVYSLCEVAIDPQDDAPSLRRKLAHAGAELLAQTLPGVYRGEIEPQEQNDAAAIPCEKINRESGRIDWAQESASLVERKCRAYTPWPGLYTHYRGKRLKVLKGYVDTAWLRSDVVPGTVVRHHTDIGVATPQGFFVLKTVQWEGKKPCSVDEFSRGHRDFVGTVLPS